MAQRLGRYELRRILGTGGHGRVYDAVLLGPGGMRKPVALKVLTKGGGLVREARIGGLLRHPNLVDVFEVGEADGRWFCAMELCPGGELSDRVPLPPRAVVDVGLQVCAALRYAHEELGLVHLDLKPQNLLLDGATVKVADLGIASARGFARKGIVAGTPGFMAPEQGRGGDVDARTDVYALGVVLAVLATGNLPGRSQTFTFASEEPPDGDGPYDAGQDGLGWLAPVLDRCLAPDPADRFASMAELARALRQLDAAGPGLVEFLGVQASPPAEPDGGSTPGGMFVGRVAELDALAAHLASPGLVTIKGPAGIGKTRLAHEAARAWSGAAWSVPLAGAGDLGALLQAVASRLGVPLPGASDAARIETVGFALRARGDALLILDTFEHLGEHAPVLGRWRALAPRLRLLVTSREPLRVDGEALLDVDVLSEGDAVALLRARALDRGVELGDDPALAAIARRLDAVPLALELAAGRLGVLTPADVLERLGLSLLRSSRADLGDRQATLRGALDWSWGLLPETERDALAQLAVFRGGFTLDAAERVLQLDPAAPWVVDVIHSLVDRSLVRRVGEARFDLLASVREHAGEHLSGEATAIRHGAWAASLDDGPLPLLTIELDNLIAAARAALSRGDVDVAVQTSCAVSQVVERSGPAGLGGDLAERALALGGGSPLQRARLEAVVARESQLMGRLGGAESHYRAALALAEGTAARGLEGRLLARLGVLSSDMGRDEEALTAIERSIGIHRALGARRDEGTSLQNLGHVHASRARQEPARAALEAALAIHREVGARESEAFVLGSLGNVQADLGDEEAACTLFEAALAAHREVGNRRAAASCMVNIGNAQLKLGRPAIARERYGLALAEAEQVGDGRLAALVLGQLANLGARGGALAEAAALYREAVARHREVTNPRGEVVALINLAEVENELGIPEARDHLRRAATVARQGGYRRYEAAALVSGAKMDVERGLVAEAGPALEEALATARDIADRWLEGLTLGEIGRFRMMRGDLDGAREAIGAGEGLLRGVRSPLELAGLLCIRAELELRAADPAAVATLAEAESLAAEAGSAALLARHFARLRGFDGPQAS